MATRRPAFTFLAAALLGGCLLGCGGVPSTGGGSGSDPTEGTERSEQTDSSGSSRPPESTLAYGGDTITGALGTYCWTQTPSGDDTLLGGICVDKAGYPVSEETLTVPTGSTLTFAYGGRKLDSLNISAYRIGQENQLKELDGGGVLVPTLGSEGNATIRLQFHRSGDQAHVAAGVPAGRYVVAAFVRVPQGDAQYGFHVVVE
jgi:hypothetical protein